MPGPAPKHPSRRQRRNAPNSGFASIPAEGRQGTIPDWPLEPDAELTARAEDAQDAVSRLEDEIEQCDDGRRLGRLRRQLDQARTREAVATNLWDRQCEIELELWNQLWSTPQATMWEASPAYARMLAQFVRWNVRGEQGDLKAAREARIRAKDFGLTPLTLMGLKVEVERAGDAETKGQRRRASQPVVPSTSGDKPKSADPRAGLYAVS